MRFATKFDRWLVLVLLLAGALTGFVMPALRLFSPALRQGPWEIAFLPLAIWTIALVSTLPQYYEVRPDCLFIRQGWRRISLPYESLSELQTMSDSRSAGVYSTDRVLVVTREGRQVLIAPADQAGFLEQVGQRAPQLERKSFGLALPFTGPTLI